MTDDKLFSEIEAYLENLMARCGWEQYERLTEYDWREISGLLKAIQDRPTYDKRGVMLMRDLTESSEPSVENSYDHL